MKQVTQQCISQDKFLTENPQYCIGMFPKVRSFGEGVNMLGDRLLDALVHETEDKNTSFLIGRLIPLWKRENYAMPEDQLNEYRFHEELRKQVVIAMAKTLHLRVIEDGTSV